MKTVIEMVREAGFDESGAVGLIGINDFLERFAALVREDERRKFTAVGEVVEAADIQWYEGITDDVAPEGAELYVRRTE